MKGKEYLFVFKNGGWWLKITSVEQLIKYHEQTDNRFAEAFANLINSKEFTKGTEHAKDLAYAIGLFGSNRHLSPIDATVQFKQRIVQTQLDCLLEYGVLYINQRGGYHFGKPDKKDYSQFVWRKELVFPSYNENDIRIKKFQGGEHWYAYVGDTQVRDGDTLKWDKYEDAYEKAKTIMDAS